MRYPLAALFFSLSPSPASASHSSNVHIATGNPPLHIQWSGFASAGAEAECHSLICSISSTRDPTTTPSKRYFSFTSLNMSVLNAGISGRASVVPGTADSRGVETFVLGTQRISAAVPEGTRVRVSVSGNFSRSLGDPNTTSVNLLARTSPIGRPGVSFSDGNFSTSYVVISGPLGPEIQGFRFGLVDQIELSGAIQMGGQTAGASHQSSFDGSFSMGLEILGKLLTGVSGTGQSGQPGAVLSAPLKIRVIDSETGAGVDGVAVSFFLSSAPAEMSQAGVLPGPGTTSGGGFIEREFRLGVFPGTYTVTARCADCIANKEVRFELIAASDQLHLDKVPGEEGGDAQKDAAGAQLPLPLRVRVTDSSGKIKPGVAVSFSEEEVPSPGVLSNPSAATDEKGIAETLYTLGPLPGDYKIKAFCGSCSTNPGNQEIFLAAASSKKPAAKKPEKSKGGTHPEPPACQTDILQVDAAPGGGPPPRPPAPILFCAGIQPINLECEGRPFDPVSSRCEGWSADPPSPSVFVNQNPPRRAEFFSGLAGLFKIQTLYSVLISRQGFEPETTRSCLAMRTVSSGLVSVQPNLAVLPADALSTKIFQGNGRDDKLNFRVGLEAVIGVKPEDIGRYLEVQVLDVNGAPTSFGSVESRQVEGNIFSFVVSFPDEFANTPSAVSTRVRACGSASNIVGKFLVTPPAGPRPPPIP